MSVSYFWNDSLPRCGLCANRFGMHPLRFYKFFDDSINGVKINEVLSNMFPYGKYSRADMKSELICQRCYTQAVEMSRRDTKWVDCFKEMDEIKNQFSHLRGRDDFDYFLNPTTNNPSTSAAPSTIVSGSTYNENSLGNRPLSTAPATIVSGSTSNENNLAPATIVSGSTSNENNLAPATIVSGSTSNEDDPESSITVNENDNEDISDNLSTASESSNASESSSTTLSENEYQEESTNMMNCTFNTCINIMSNRVYSKSGAFYSCIIPSCKLFFKTFYKFKLHYRQHRNVNGMVCWTCIKVLPNRSKMRKHKNKDSCKFPGMFVCVSCKESFNDLQSISHHKYIKHIKN
ncbi:uncharacterized protein LOC114132680 isoform X39 [Aphis gossypii]|uniref:uncharacterized protein LOC114132680 isoform X28 n=1 Tax=Aphis gossypii TaxID=80765 RepID=UPI002158D0F5|nr:uncharacterized protein LOC114132680 isoform X28 [Aphis gossypii]XP_050062612.1 uncharacterized protein LOC114132680 isoform X29 [Aphis gossypii]XP_050062613.1 uncharacterized protein LOC114132680 isoform X30 [Aphis gossypii]XP_050062614.1 uncharacterized protein LOC114132680 isoform X31 [Aphis gossypii]XP_050062615.1 uncharacterized protein LOC114132680 isoform X32 [Aphis gossypii]XP_050062616.1 uncharacterized protein LOC114132680 isoform X33 [Aphis gossypii]XP_050062617.1 uncharacterize